MNSLKRLGMAALLVVLAALLAASPAMAGKVVDPLISSTTYELAPPVDADAPEPEACGQWTLDQYGDFERLTVNCRRLTPGEQYVVVSLVEWTSKHGVWGVGWIISSGSYLEEHPVTADGKGRLNAQFFVYSEQWWVGGWEGGWYDSLTRHVAGVWIVNATTGEVVLEEP